MGYENLVLEYRGSVAVLTINRPKVLNALNRATLLELSRAVEEVAGNPAVKAVVITGVGEKAFVAGADIAEMSAMSPAEAKEFALLGQQIFAKIENAPVPFIAAVNGFALGGGCELAMSCDIRLASSRAKFGQPEINLGISPGFGGTQRLPRLIGKGKGLELLLTGDLIDGETALRLGLINRLVPDGEVLAEACALAEKIAEKSRPVLGYVKAAVHRGYDLDLPVAAEVEALYFSLCFATADQKEGMAAFLEKRKPRFADR